MRTSVEALLSICAVGMSACADPGPADPARITLPDGFVIHEYAAVPGARSMARAEDGTIFVGTRGDRVFAVRDEDGDQIAERVITLASGLDVPNGVAVKGGALYVAEVSRILRYDDVLARLEDPPEPAVLRDDYPTDRSHGWKYIAFGPDGWLYVPVGAPCNVCARDEEIYATLTRLSPDFATREIYARGIRNTVGFTWHPDTGELWFTDNGRDRLGDDLPPDELNRAPQAGLHFGYPYCHGGDLADPDLGPVIPCEQTTPPAQKLGPHVAALGVKFYGGDMFPEAYRGQAFIAEHGSWNRSVPIGYRVTRVRLGADGAPVEYAPFATGWLDEPSGAAWGRPVDLLELPDGSLLVSDDKASRIWRIRYAGPRGRRTASVAQPVLGIRDRLPHRGS